MNLCDSSLPWTFYQVRGHLREFVEIFIEI